MNCISSRSIHACAQLRNVCSRSHFLPARPFASFSLARVCSLRDRAPARRASSSAAYRASTVRSSYKNCLSASRLSQRSSSDRNMSSNATATTAEKVTTADNNPLLEVSCFRRCFLLRFCCPSIIRQKRITHLTSIACVGSVGLRHSTIRQDPGRACCARYQDTACRAQL